VRERRGRIGVEQAAGGDEVPRHRVRGLLGQGSQLSAGRTVEVARIDVQRRQQALLRPPALLALGQRRPGRTVVACVGAA
jgi:hypothetical protein